MDICQMAKEKLCRKSSFGLCVASTEELNQCPFYQLENMFKQFKIELTEDTEHLRKVNSALDKNEELYGKRYCPCSLERTDATVCPCKDFLNMESGTCHCGKYIKTEIDYENM